MIEGKKQVRAHPAEWLHRYGRTDINKPVIDSRVGSKGPISVRCSWQVGRTGARFKTALPNGQTKEEFRQFRLILEQTVFYAV